MLKKVKIEFSFTFDAGLTLLEDYEIDNVACSAAELIIFGIPGAELGRVKVRAKDVEV